MNIGHINPRREVSREFDYNNLSLRVVIRHYTIADSGWQ